MCDFNCFLLFLLISFDVQDVVVDVAHVVGELVAAKVAAARAGGKIVEAVARVREPSERPWDQRHGRRDTTDNARHYPRAPVARPCNHPRPPAPIQYLVGIRCLATVLQGSGATALRVLTALSRTFATSFRIIKLAHRRRRAVHAPGGSSCTT